MAVSSPSYPPFTESALFVCMHMHDLAWPFFMHQEPEPAAGTPASSSALVLRSSSHTCRKIHACILAP
eukprot:1159348-Pelagomonas_calceolata.AAC.10